MSKTTSFPYSVGRRRCPGSRGRRACSDGGSACNHAGPFRSRAGAGGAAAAAAAAAGKRRKATRLPSSSPPASSSSSKPLLRKRRLNPPPPGLPSRLARLLLLLPFESAWPSPEDLRPAVKREKNEGERARREKRMRGGQKEKKHMDADVENTGQKGKKTLSITSRCAAIPSTSASSSPRQRRELSARDLVRGMAL